MSSVDYRITFKEDVARDSHVLDVLEDHLLELKFNGREIVEKAEEIGFREEDT